MVEILDLPLDDDNNSDRLPDIHRKYEVPSETINIANPNEDQIRNINHNEKEGKSCSSPDLFSVDYINRNQFLEAKDILEEMIKLENEYPELNHTVVKQSKGKRSSILISVLYYGQATISSHI